MKIGICCGLDLAPLAASAGFEFCECNVSGMLKPLESEEVFEQTLRAVESLPIKYEAASGFIPGEIKLVGPDTDHAAQDEYALTTIKRASKMGLDVIVLGSGQARMIPDGFDKQLAREQFVDFARRVAEMAVDHNITIVLEPLNSGDCNFLTTVGQCTSVVKDVDHPGLRMLVDAYHWMYDNDSVEDIVAAGPLLKHLHIATRTNRKIPGAEPCDFTDFFTALSRAGYDGRLSIEARIADPEINFPKTLPLLRELCSN